MICEVLVFPDEYSKPAVKMFHFDTFHIPLKVARFPVMSSTKCQESNRFPCIFFLLLSKLERGMGLTKKGSVMCSVKASCQNAVILCPDCANTDNTFNMCSLSFQRKVCQLSRHTLSVCTRTRLTFFHRNHHHELIFSERSQVYLGFVVVYVALIASHLKQLIL